MLTSIRPCLNRYAMLGVILISVSQMCAAQGGGYGAEEFGGDEYGGRAPRRTQTTKTVQDKGFLLRTYDVGDLVMNIYDHPYSDSLKHSAKSSGGPSGFGGGMGGGGGMVGGGGGMSMGMGMGMEGGGFGATGRELATSDPENITMDDLLRVLTTTVSAASWSLNGGPGQVEPLGSAFVVWQSPTVHDQIQDLLQQLRAGSGERKTFTIDARWLLVNSDDLDRLILPNQEGLPKVDRKLLASLTRRPSSLRGITSCFSGQTVYLVSGTRRNVVSSYIPVVGSLDDPNGMERFANRHDEEMIRFVAEGPGFGGEIASRVGYQPVVSTHNFGALLEIRPTWLRGSEVAVVDLKSTLTVPGEQAGKVADRSLLAPTPPVVDRIAIETQELATTIRMPLGQPVLVGGLTYVPPSLGATRNSDPTAAASREGSAEQPRGTQMENRQLYFFLELR